MTTTSGTPNPTWYDVLGVPTDASPAEIKAAWRTATDRFEPGSGAGQFRMFNDAADVLLDPARREAYDASLAADTNPSVETATPPPPPPVSLDKADPADTADPADPAVSAGSRTPGPPATRSAVVVALVLLLLTAAAVATATVLGLRVRQDARIADARDEAPAAAERAAKAMLSYDYRHLPADRKRAAAYLTDGFEKKYLTNFALLEKQKDGTPGAAVQTKSVVTASVLGSGVVDAEDTVVRVLVYVNQVSKKAGVDPQIFQNRVAMTMEKDGNRWLVGDLKSY